MRYTSLLPTVALAFIATSIANAAEDFTSELYLPSEMETLYDTSISFGRTSLKKHEAKEDFVLRETALIGFDNEAAVLASVGNRFNFKHVTNEDYNNDLNKMQEILNSPAFSFPINSIHSIIV